MAKFYFLCMYCGKKWDQMLYSSIGLDEIECTSCGDSSIKISQESPTGDVFGYKDKQAADAYIKKGK